MLYEKTPTGQALPLPKWEREAPFKPAQLEVTHCSCCDTPLSNGIFYVECQPVCSFCAAAYRQFYGGAA